MLINPLLILFFTFSYGIETCTDELPIKINDSHKTKRLINKGRTIYTDIGYIVGLIYRNQFFCSGTVISEQFILTAAKCAEKYKNTDVKIQYKNNFILQLLHINFYRNIKKIYPHPQYDRNSLSYNAAIIKVDVPITYYGLIDNIVLPKLKPSLITNAPTHIQKLSPRPRGFVLENITRLALVVGWQSQGYNYDTLNTFVTTALVVPILPQNLCKKILNPDKLNESEFCAGYYNKEYSPACKLDAGGPLMLDGKQYGIISKNLLCDSSYLPSIFTSVQIIRNFIKDITGV